MSETSADPLVRLDVKSFGGVARVKAILVGSIGNLIEWYDFYVYAAFSLYFSGSFFPGSDPVAQALSTSHRGFLRSASSCAPSAAGYSGTSAIVRAGESG
jgi:hypothetical protein